MGTGRNAIAVQGLRMRYGSNEAVRGIDFEVREGEVFGFLGTNGAGKTTTIEILEGYRKRTAGEVSVLGIDPGSPTRAWRNRIGLVLQDSELDPTLTVHETVSLFASFYDAPRSVDETVELVGLGAKRGERVGRLSGGQRRRADVAVGIIGDPDLIFLDEPTTGFDPSARRESWNMIEGLKQLGKTIFLTTHYMDEAQHLSDRVTILRRGEIVASGRPDELGGREQTVISFRAPERVVAADVRAAIEHDVETAGATIVVRSERPQADLYRLLGWAERERIELEAIEVVRPTLEDVFLALARDDGDAT